MHYEFNSMSLVTVPGLIHSNQQSTTCNSQIKRYDRGGGGGNAIYVDICGIRRRTRNHGVSLSPGRYELSHATSTLLNKILQCLVFLLVCSLFSKIYKFLQFFIKRF